MPHAPTIKAASPDAQPPTASQTSANSGASKRIVSNGEHVVLNSDSDSDSLLDIDWGVPTTFVKTVVGPTTRPKRTTQHDEDGLRKPEKKPRKKTFDHVFETARKNRDLEQVISAHKANLDKKEEEGSDFVSNENALGQAVQDDNDPDRAHKLHLAIQRTNATQEEKVYHFFHDISDSGAVQTRFPTHVLPEHRWTSSFRGTIALSELQGSC